MIAKICPKIIYRVFGYIEKLPTITLSEIIADTKWISEPYRILLSGVKLKAQKIRL